MKIVIILILFSLSIGRIVSNEWEEIYTVYGTPKTIECINSETCFILTISFQTRVYKTTDAGNSWELLNTIQNDRVEDMSCPDSMNIFLAFWDGTIYKSSDAGKSFESFKLEGINHSKNITMYDTNIGVLHNGWYITHDGWESYNVFNIAKNKISYSYLYPHFINDSMLYAIVRVFDQRDPQYHEPPVDRPIVSGHINHSFMKLNINTLEYEIFYIDHFSGSRDFFVLNEQNLFVCGKSHEISGGSGNDAIYKSTDGGKTWRRVLDLYSDRTKFHRHFYSPFGLQSIAFKDSLTGIAVGQFGKIVYTYDGGESWTYESKLPPKLGGGESKPATMLVRYAGSMPIIAAYNSSIHLLKEDKLAPSSKHKYSISGRVWEGDKGQAGIPISLDTFRVTMTDKDGYYRFGNLKEGSYQVRALNKYFDDANPTYYYKPFAYTPLEYNIELTSDTTGFDFNAEDLRTFYRVEGYVVDDKGQGIPDIFLRTGSSTTTTDESGKFEFPKIESRRVFDVIPYSDKLEFTPKWHRINLIIGDTTNLLFTATPATSVRDQMRLQELAIHPNPATDYVYINFNDLEGTRPPSYNSGLVGVRIYNTLGQCVSHLTPTLSKGEGVRIDVSHLPPGVYLVRVGNKVEKFVKW